MIQANKISRQRWLQKYLTTSNRANNNIFGGTPEKGEGGEEGGQGRDTILQNIWGKGRRSALLSTQVWTARKVEKLPALMIRT